MNRFLFLSLFLSFSLNAQDTLLGFGSAEATLQQQLEAQFDNHLDANEMDEWLKFLSNAPHHVGTEKGIENVEFIADKFRSWGFDTEIVEYEVLFPSPRTRELELVFPRRYSATLTEDSLEQDPSTSSIKDLLPPYNAFSIDGEVEGELVFVNYGTPADYEILDRYGVSVEGKIAVSRYGGSWRGIKPKLAGEKGAIATIIYSDPADDGYGAGDTYPEGPFKHESGVQRGSVMDMPTYPGDVLTPFIGATAEAPRLDRNDAPTITKIPVLPISYRDALPLLEAMGGATVPREWQGGLPITYHLGPGPARVRMKLDFNWDMVKAYNVIARLPGAQYPEQWVIRGNHHDGWNHGAADPISGLVALMAEAKSIGELAKDGSPPARTIIYAAWDAEEQGLIGSTEWVEHHANELSEHAVAYINTDGNSRGFVNIGGSHVLEKMANEVMRDVDDPQTGESVGERRRADLTINGASEKVRQDAKNRKDLRISPLGSGSDYSPFLQHLGIASLNISFGGEAPGGSYHTLYDTYEHYTKFIDPGLVYGVSLAQVAGRATLRLANASRLPFEFTGLTDNIEQYMNEIEMLTDSMREETKENNDRIQSGIYQLVLDPQETYGPPSIKTEVPYINFAPLKNAIAQLNEASNDYLSRANSSASEADNRLIYLSERQLTQESGLPGRPWFTHHIYAPGFYTGYGVKTIPGVREAIEQREFSLAEEEIYTAAEVILSMAEHINRLGQ